MKPTKKETIKTKDKTKKIKKNTSDKKIKELEDLVVLMDKKMLSLDNKVSSMLDVFERIRGRMGI